MQPAIGGGSELPNLQAGAHPRTHEPVAIYLCSGVGSRPQISCFDSWAVSGVPSDSNLMHKRCWCSDKVLMHTR